MVNTIGTADRRATTGICRGFYSVDSSQLRNLVSGDWKESRENIIGRNHVDTETIKTLSTFLHAGEYRRLAYQIVDDSDDTIFHASAGLLQG